MYCFISFHSKPVSLYRMLAMLSECVIALIAQVVLCSNVYLVAVFFVHRDQFTPKTLLQVGTLPFGAKDPN